MSSLSDQIIARLKELREQMRYYGLIMGGALILIELLQFIMHNSVTLGNMFILMIIKITIMFVVSNQLVKRIKGEFFKTGMTYGQAFSVIFRLFLYASILVGIFSFVLNQWLAPNYQAEFVSNTMDYLQAYMARFSVPEAQLEYIEEMIEEIKDTPSPTPQSTMWGIMWAYLVWGAIVSFILSFSKRDKDISPFGKIENNEQS